MPSTPQPPWDDYDKTSEDDLEALLGGRVDAALNPDDPTTADEVRELAGRIADHEQDKLDAGAGDYHPRLHEEANRVRAADTGSWRPK